MSSGLSQISAEQRSPLEKCYLHQCQIHDGISIFHIHHSSFIITLQDGYERIFSVIKNELFVFVVNGEDVESNDIDAVLISTKVHESLRLTPTNFQFVINDDHCSVSPKTNIRITNCH
jgi:hypothetical protein